jgi:transposase
MRVAAKIVLTPEESERLTRDANSRSGSVRSAERAKIILAAAQGQENQEIARDLGLTRQTVGRWRDRFFRLGISGIERDAPRSGRKVQIDAEEVVRKTTQEKPQGATHWSTRSLAKEMGVSEATVRRIWHRHGLKPHLAQTFKVSKDVHFVKKLEDVVGLYINPPEHAIVLSVDEKSQIQALDRTQPGLPLKKGRCGTLTHDYKRNGTTTLFAALNTLTGQVFGTCMPRHRHQEWLKFLKLIDESTEPEKQLHLIADNYGSHKHPKVLAWLKKHPRFHMHFVPTSASWLNMIERFFRELTTKQLRRGVFRSVEDLVDSIEQFLSSHNNQPSPYIWTAKATDILAKVNRARKTLNMVEYK